MFIFFASCKSYLFIFLTVWCRFTRNEWKSVCQSINSANNRCSYLLLSYYRRFHFFVVPLSPLVPIRLNYLIHFDQRRPPLRCRHKRWWPGPDDHNRVIRLTTYPVSGVHTITPYTLYTYVNKCAYHLQSLYKPLSTRSCAYRRRFNRTTTSIGEYHVHGSGP